MGNRAPRITPEHVERGLTPQQINRLKGYLGNWYLALNPTYKWVEYQQRRIIPALERLEKREGKRKLMVEVPPGHAKTDLGTRAFIPWYMGRHPDHNVAITGYADDLVREFGRDIRNICNSSLARAVFPQLELTADSRAISHFKTVGGNQCYTAGLDGAWYGRRLNCFVLDDPVKNLLEAQSETVMKTRFDIYRSVVKSRLRPNAIVLANLTRFGLADFAARVLAFEKDEWEVLIIDAENEDGGYLWEDYYGKEWYESAKRDPETWWAQYRQRPREFEDEWFKKDWLNFYKIGSVPDTWPHYIIVDGAKSTSAKADRTSAPVIAAGPERRAFVVDWLYDRLDPGQRATALVGLIRRWNPRQILYEEKGWMSDAFYFNERLAREKISCRVTPVGTKGPRSQLSTEARIRELQTDFREARIWLPESLKKTLASGEEIDVIETFINEEYLKYKGHKSVPHDDGLDSLSRLHEKELHLDFQEAEQPPPIEDRPQEGKSWETEL